MKRLLQAYRCADSDEALKQLAAWYRTPLGEELYRQESRVVARLLPNLFGYHLLQVGLEERVAWLEASRIRHQVVMGSTGGAGESRGSGPLALHGRPEALPFASDSLDLVLLPHLLEFIDTPHQLLREAERVLIPEGHLLIAGFNPLSLWGVSRLLFGWNKRVPWCGHFYTVSRIRDWLELLGFDTVAINKCHYRLPLYHPRFHCGPERLDEVGARYCSGLGGSYLILARKRVATLTPIRPRWRVARPLVKPGFTETRTNRNRE